MGASCAFELEVGLGSRPGVFEDDQPLLAGSISADLQHVLRLHHPKTRQLPRPETLRGTQFVRQ